MERWHNHYTPQEICLKLIDYINAELLPEIRLLDPNPAGVNYDLFCKLHCQKSLAETLIKVQFKSVVANTEGIFYALKKIGSPLTYQDFNQVYQGIVVVATAIEVSRVLLVFDNDSNAIISASKKTLKIH